MCGAKHTNCFMILLFPLMFLTEGTELNELIPSPPNGALATKNRAGENLVFIPLYGTTKCSY